MWIRQYRTKVSHVNKCMFPELLLFLFYTLDDDDNARRDKSQYDSGEEAAIILV